MIRNCEKFEISVVFIFCFLILLNYAEYQYEFCEGSPHEVSARDWNIPLFLSINILPFIQPQKPFHIREILFYFFLTSLEVSGRLFVIHTHWNTHTYKNLHISQKENLIYIKLRRKI